MTPLTGQFRQPRVWSRARNNPAAPTRPSLLWPAPGPVVRFAFAEWWSRQSRREKRTPSRPAATLRKQQTGNTFLPNQLADRSCPVANLPAQWAGTFPGDFLQTAVRFCPELVEN